MKNEIKCRFSQKHDIEANWIKAGNAENPFIPWEAELIIYDPDENYNYTRFKIGDGVTNVNDLPFSTKQADWSQNDENAADYVKNRTHYPEVGIRAETIASHSEGSLFYGDFTTYLDLESLVGKIITLNINGNVYQYELKRELYSDCVIYCVGDWLDYLYGGTDEFSAEFYDTGICFLLPEFDEESAPSTIPVSISCVEIPLKQLDDKFIPDTIARVDHYDKYDKDSFSANDTAKAISAKSAAFGFNTQAGSFAYTVTALDPVAKTFTLDSVEGLEVDDIYTVDLSFYKADGTATEEVYANYGKITAISADNVVTVDTFPSDVARYRVPDEPYIDENGLDGEENVFRVIAKPNVGNRAIGTKSFAMGNGSQALSKNSVAMGKNCIAYGAHSVAIGYDNKTAHTATSFGKSNTASGLRSVAIGDKNTSSGSCTIAMGEQNTSTTNGAVAMGILNKANTRTSIALGERNTADGKGAIALGYKNTSSGERTFAGGHSNKVEGMYSIALGYNNTSKGEGSTAFGNSNTASNKGSFASGTGNKATGTNSFALGSTNRATGTSSFAHGYNNDATQTGSAVFGTNSKSQGESSFAAGADVAASGHYSQAFGHKTKATGESSFAAGEDVAASGLCSQAFGDKTKATGYMSFAEGTGTKAIGFCSFAEGEGTIANGMYQHVQGKYNIEDTVNEYAHIVGNGRSYERSNAYTLDWKGNAWFAGEVTVGANKEKLATEAELIELEERLKEYIDNQILAAITSALNTEV